jgi:hypothetical protein
MKITALEESIDFATLELYALDDSVWGMKITALEESIGFATLDTKNNLAN